MRHVATLHLLSIPSSHFRRFLPRQTRTRVRFSSFFKKKGFNVHVYESDNPEIKRQLKFRDWLIKHPEDKEQYERLKLDLAKKYPNDFFSYWLGKEALIGTINTKAGSNNLKMVMALTPKEWAATKRFRNNAKDLEDLTFTHKDHKHVILYKGPHIIGYAHIQLLAPPESVIHMLAISEEHHNKDDKAVFTILLKKWLRQQGYHILPSEDLVDN